jgi:hypothetical protein
MVHNRRAAADDAGKRPVGIDRHERGQAQKQDVGVMKNDRARVGVRRATACGTQKAGADRGGDKEQRHQRRRRGAEQNVKLVPAVEHA